MPTISIKAEEIFNIAGFSVTNGLLTAAIILVLLFVMAAALKSKLELIPGMFQNMVELGIEKFLGLMETILGSSKKAEKYLPFIATLFIFILFSNWLGLFPGVGSIGWKHNGEFTPYLRAPSSDLNFTLMLALVSVILTNIFAFKEIGFKAHLSKYFNFKGPIDFFVGILEIISEFAKIISFSFRLFGNIFAGEVLLLIISFLLPMLGPIPFILLEVFVGFIQAFVFSILTLVFLSTHLQRENAH